MKAAHNVLYMKKHTQTYASYPAMDISCMTERGVDLVAEGVSYIDIHREPATYVLCPPPSSGGDFELEGVVNACHFEYVTDRTSFETPTCEAPSNGVVEVSLLPVCTGDTSI